MKVLFQNEILRLAVGRVTVMFQILFDVLFGDVADAPGAVAYHPEVSAPILFPQIALTFSFNRNIVPVLFAY